MWSKLTLLANSSLIAHVMTHDSHMGLAMTYGTNDSYLVWLTCDMVVPCHVSNNTNRIYADCAPVHTCGASMFFGIRSMLCPIIL